MGPGTRGILGPAPVGRQAEGHLRRASRPRPSGGRPGARWTSLDGDLQVSARRALGRSSGRPRRSATVHRRTAEVPALRASGRRLPRPKAASAGQCPPMAAVQVVFGIGAAWERTKVPINRRRSGPSGGELRGRATGQAGGTPGTPPFSAVQSGSICRAPDPVDPVAALNSAGPEDRLSGLAARSIGDGPGSRRRHGQGPLLDPVARPRCSGRQWERGIRDRGRPLREERVKRFRDTHQLSRGKRFATYIENDHPPRPAPATAARGGVRIGI